MAKARGGGKRAKPAIPKVETGSAPASFPIVGIGASAGGLEALTHLAEHLAPNIGVAYLIVQHLDPKHKSMLVELVGRHTSLPIQEVRGPIQVEKDHVYVIPPNRNMFIERGKLRLSPRRRGPAAEMPIDLLFRTLALDQPSNCIGVVLSGTGSDGALGIEEIKSAGGITFAQDSESAKYDGMPRAAIGTGCVDFVLPPELIARELKRIAAHPFTNGKVVVESSQDAFLHRIFLLLKNRTTVDFKHYKQNTVKRRIFRRMALLRIEALSDYVRLLSDNLPELDLLYQDLLIKVTSFFREPGSFRVLHEQVFPAIMEGRDRHEPIRLWVPGCSTGEEVYSLAMALLEFLGDDASLTPIQIFGTDVSDRALEKARAGIYIENIALDVSAARLRRWFVRVDRGYQIAKGIREMCVFAKQNVTTDPPFSKIDLISCRNLLIYLDNVFQTRVMPIFHYALKPNGFLMLGNSESVGTFLNLFDPVDKKAKIYTKKPVTRSLEGISFNQGSTTRPGPESPAALEMRQPPDLYLEADRFIVSRFAPNGVIVDEDFKIVQFRGSTGDYLEPSPGRAAFHLLKMARGNLGLELRTLLQRVRSANRAFRKTDVLFQAREGVAREISIEVAPLQSNAGSANHFLILFEENAPAGQISVPPAESGAGLPARKEDNPETNALRHELSTTKAYLQSTIEDSEATTEELKSANEEIMSSNEELQSTNEELETAKEELQSTNEELTTVNEEVQTRNIELNQLNGDLNNFLGSVKLPFIMLGTNLKIRRFTAMAQRVFNLVPTDVGRSFGEIKPKVNIPDLEKRIATVIDTMTVHELEVQDHEGHCYQLSIRPYRTPENKIEGAILVFLDITAIRQSLLQVEEARLYAESIVETVLDPLLVLDSRFVIQRANPAYYRLFATDAERTEKRSLFALDKSQWDIPAVRDILRSSLNPRKSIVSVEITETFSRIGRKTIIVHCRAIRRKDGAPALILMTLRDITDLVQVQNQIVEASSREQRRIAHDLHDGVGQQLAAVGYRIRALKSHLTKARAPQSREAEEIGTLVETALAQTRDLAKFLLPVAVDEQGLMDSLRELARTTSRLYKVNCQFRCRQAVLIRDGEVALNAYRIAQEAVHNAIKHGKPKQIVIGLRAAMGSTELSIANDGRNFQPQQIKRKRGMGVQIMRYRANLIHGKLNIEARRPRGTSVKCFFNPKVRYDH